MELKKYILFPLMIFTIYGSAQCDRNLDSLILVDLYNNTGGPDWTIPWNLAQPMDTWYGIVLTKAGCVKCIDLDGSDNCIGIDYNNLGNNLSGEIPESIGIG